MGPYLNWRLDGKYDKHIVSRSQYILKRILAIDLLFILLGIVFNYKQIVIITKYYFNRHFRII